MTALNSVLLGGHESAEARRQRRLDTFHPSYRRFVRDRAGKRRQHRVSVGDTDKLGLGTVETGVDTRVAEEGAAGALRHSAGAAGGARSVRNEAHVHDAVTGTDRRDVRPHLDCLAYELVPHDRPVLEAGDVTVERAEIGAADGRGVDTDNRVRSRNEGGIGNVLEADVLRPAQYDGLHASCSISTR